VQNSVVCAAFRIEHDTAWMPGAHPIARIGANSAVRSHWCLADGAVQGVTVRSCFQSDEGAATKRVCPCTLARFQSSDNGSPVVPAYKGPFIQPETEKDERLWPVEL
jgi:hypothetical protein